MRPASELEMAGGAATYESAVTTLDQAEDLALVVIDGDRRIRLALGGLLAARGIEASEISGRCVDEVDFIQGVAAAIGHERRRITRTAHAFGQRDAAGREYEVNVLPSGSRTDPHATLLWRERNARHEAETALDRSEQRYRILAENSSDVVSLQTADARILWISPSAQTIFGRSPEDLVGGCAYELVHPDDLGEIRKRDAHVRSGLRHARSTTRMRHADGTYRWVETTLHAVAGDGMAQPGTVVLSGRDVTTRVLAEQALRESEARAQTLLETMTDAAVLYDGDGCVLTRNSLSRELMGDDDDALRLLTPASVAGWVDEERIALTPRQHPAALARNRSQPVTVIAGVRRGDGARRWVRATASRVQDADFNGALVMTLYDITELRDQGVELERSNEDLRRMALVASHDLGAPLAMLRRELAAIPTGDLPEGAAERLRRASGAADSMHELLGAVLAHAQVERAEIGTDVVALGDVAGETQVVLRTRLDESGAQLKIFDLHDVVGERVLLRQLLQNLVSNAVTHNPGPHPVVVVRSELRSGTRVLIVEDDGNGVPADKRESVFGLFARNGSGAPGHGIGLATAKRIVELHGGRIWIEDAHPHGARFCVTLPPPG